MRDTGYALGRPGYVVDHIVPLACGGPDDPSNMQWQTIEDAKAKDEWERKDCAIWTAANSPRLRRLFYVSNNTSAGFSVDSATRRFDNPAGAFWRHRARREDDA